MAELTMDDLKAQEPRLEPEPTTLYVAGPMSGLPDYNEAAFGAAAEYLRNAGYRVVDPAAKSRELPVEEIDTVPHGEWLRQGLVEMLGCQGIALLPGWRESRGASLERGVAEAVGMQVGTVDWWLAQAEAR